MALKPKISMLSKSYIHIQHIRIIPQRFRLSRLAGKRGEAGSSGCTGKGPYELQREWHSGEVYDLAGKQGSTVTSSAADTKVRSLAPTVGDPTTDLESMGGGSNTNRILRTVHIETVQESRDNPDSDVDMQPNITAW